jgi:amino acid transporter
MERRSTSQERTILSRRPSVDAHLGHRVASDTASPSQTDPPTPDADLPALDADEIQALREAGRAWGRQSNGGSPSLPVDPSLEATIDDASSGRDPDAVARRVRRAVLGPPLKSTAIVQERMRKLVALPVLSADALSSVAYGPEAMLAVLVLAGGAGLAWSLPISGAIVFMMLVVGTSYRQTIRAYPQGGGSYIVATANLGRVAGLMAAAGLITDYVLTVAVSISSGLAAVTSALPSLHSAVVPLGVAMIAFLFIANVRGVRQAGALFAAPTYLFVGAVALLVIVGLVDAAGRDFHALPRPAVHASEAVGLLLVLRAFASGSTAMTGVEAISNAVPVFKPPEWRNARTTLSWMIGLLVTMFVAIVVLVELGGIVPVPGQTVLSQLARQEFGSGVLYVYIQTATALVLLLAANTAYNDFPRVMFLLARDRCAPRPFLKMGDRLAFNNGILLLSVVATLVFVAFKGVTESLIPLYAVGVFLAFTLSQAGMVVHWWQQRSGGWRRSIVFNAVGCAMTAVVFLIAAITKFTAGAWVSLLIVALFTAVALLTHRHFDRVAGVTALDRVGSSSAEGEETPAQVSNLAIVPVPHLDRATMRALAYAASLHQPVLALHISPTDEDARRFREYWTDWGDHVPLEIVSSPYRAVIPPTIAYIEALRAQSPELTLTVIVPDLAVRHWWQRLLYEDTAARLRHALAPLRKVIVTSVPFHV